MEGTTFTCSICGDSSREICVFCTKDACANHLCERCRRCSDCCACEVPLTPREQTTRVEPLPHATVESAIVPNGTGEFGPE